MKNFNIKNEKVFLKKNAIFLYSTEGFLFQIYLESNKTIKIIVFCC